MHDNYTQRIYLWKLVGLVWEYSHLKHSKAIRSSLSNHPTYSFPLFSTTHSQAPNVCVRSGSSEQQASKVVLWEGESRAVCCVLGQTCPDTHRPLPQMRERFDWGYHSHSSKSLTHIQTSREETEEKRREEKRREEKRREEKRREEKRREEKRREEKNNWILKRCLLKREMERAGY